MAKINFNLQGTLSEALQQLINQYNATPEYTARTSDQLKAQAEADYGSYYNNLKTAAQIAQERDDLALAQQAAALDTTYNKVRDASAKDYRRAYSQADRQMMSRGMQRSSYGAQTLANLAQEGVEAQRDIWDQQAAAENNIAAQRAQREGQLADLLRQYDNSYASDVLKRIFELENQDYERQMQNTEYLNNLANQIYNYLQNNLQWNDTSTGGGGYYSEPTKKKSSGSGSSSTQTKPASTNTVDDLVNGINTWKANQTVDSVIGKIAQAAQAAGGKGAVGTIGKFVPMKNAQSTTTNTSQSVADKNKARTKAKADKIYLEGLAW